MSNSKQEASSISPPSEVSIDRKDDDKGETSSENVVAETDDGVVYARVLGQGEEIDN